MVKSNNSPKAFHLQSRVHRSRFGHHSANHTRETRNNTNCTFPPVCDRLGWYRVNGQRKDMSCRDALRRLEKMGLLTLPASTQSDSIRGGGFHKASFHSVIEIIEVTSNESL